MIFDLILIAIVAVCVCFGYKRGFIKTLRSLCSFVLSILVAIFLHGTVTALIDNSLVGAIIREWITKHIDLSKIDVSKFGVLSNIASDSTESIADTVAANMTTAIISVLAILITIVASKLLINLLFKALNLFSKLPVIKQCNKLLGASIGAFNGYFWISILMYAVLNFSDIGVIKVAKELMTGSSLAPILEEYNLLLLMFK